MIRLAKAFSGMMQQPKMKLGCAYLGVTLLLLLSYSALIARAFLHPAEHAALLSLSALSLLPTIAAVSLRRSWLRGILVFEKLDPKDTRNAPKIFLRNPVFLVVLPILIAAMGWGLFHYLLTSKPDSGTAVEWLEKRLHILLLTCLSPLLLASCYWITHQHLKLAVYLAACCLYISITIAVGGLKLEEGVVGFFTKWKAQSSPLVTLSSAVIVAVASGIIHYAVSLWKPTEYVGIHNLQDAFYFSVVTMATVGYGDVTPTGHLARWLTSAQIAISFVMLVVAVSASMTIWIQNHQPKGARVETSNSISE